MVCNVIHSARNLPEIWKNFETPTALRCVREWAISSSTDAINFAQEDIMKRFIKSFAKKTSSLYQSIHERLSVYAGAAVVVSLFALTHPSEAKIVYTPAKVDMGQNDQYKLDLNHDGISDFTLQAVFEEKELCYPRPPFTMRYLQETPAQGGGVADDTNGAPTALHKGVEIGPNLGFNPAAAYMAYFADGYWRYSQTYCAPKEYLAGTWINVTDRYLGLKFQIHGKLHFGWARLSVELTGPPWHVWISTQLTGYAYETIAGKAIIAGQTQGSANEAGEEDFGSGASLTTPIPDKPQPASLGVLALGAQGVPLWRRKESILEGGLKGTLL
jgi:hypothetical protein